MSFCPVCGMSLKQNASFCSNCGASVAGYEEARDEGAHEGHGSREGLCPKSRRRPVALIVLGSIVLAAGIAVAVFLGAKTFLPSFLGFTFVNPVAFPDEMMRDAVSEQLDSDGDGILSSSDTEKVCSAIIKPDGIEFFDSPQEMGALDTAASDDPGSVSSLECLRFFPNLETIDCSGSQIAAIDISRNTNLTYANLCGTGIKSIDVSNNKELVSLYCDEGVSVSGFDNSDLYSRDLITSASYKPADSSDATTIDITYDSYGRPLEATDGKGYRRLYSYGDYGVETCMIFGDMMVTCAYDEQGRIASAVTTNSAGDVTDENLYFKYGDSGLLASFERSSLSKYKSEMYTSSLSFDNGFLLKQNVDVAGISGPKRTRFATWDYDSAGRVVANSKSAVCEDISRSGDYVHEIKRAFDDDGLCTSDTCEVNQVAGKQGTERIDISRESDGAASVVYANEIYGSSGHTGTQNVQANAEGYITSVFFDDPGTNRNGGQISVSYVKRIAPLSEREYSGGIPVFQIETTGHTMALDSSVTNWFVSEDAQIGWLSLVEHDPWSDPLYYYGISDNAVNVANEDAIASYDASRRSGKSQVFEAKEANTPSAEQVSDAEKEYLEFMALSYWSAMGDQCDVGDGVVANQSAENLSRLISEICNPGMSADYLRNSQHIDKSRFEIEDLNNHVGNPKVSELDGLQIVASYCGKENTPEASALQKRPVSYDGSGFVIESYGVSGGCEIESSEMSKSDQTYTFKCRMYRTGSSIGSKIRESVIYQVEAVADVDSLFGARLISMKPLS